MQPRQLLRRKGKQKVMARRKALLGRFALLLTAIALLALAGVWAPEVQNIRKWHGNLFGGA